LHVYNHILTFTKLAAYSASVVKSNFYSWEYKFFYHVEYATPMHTGGFTFSVAGLDFLGTFSRSVFSAFPPSGSVPERMDSPMRRNDYAESTICIVEKSQIPLR